jgi:F0F1-type ATP synthase assembly protein I
MNKLGIIIGLLIGFGLFGAYNVKTKAKLKSNQEVSATQFVTKIEELGYYKYTDKKILIV